MGPRFRAAALIIVFAALVSATTARTESGRGGMIEPPKELLEPYFFDFSGELYGQTIEVALRHFLRPEMKFDSLDTLKTQMAEDCEQARSVLA